MSRVFLYLTITSTSSCSCHCRVSERWGLEYLPGGRYVTVIFSSVALNCNGADTLKTNNAYGETGVHSHLITTTEFGDLQNGRLARSNTYDNPQEAAIGGTTAAPTYDTVKNVKEVAGPPVPNPVYGPHGAMPTSPHSPSPKNIPNPVYSETAPNIPPQELADVSALSPVYAAIGKHMTTQSSDNPSPRYAYAYRSVTNGHSTPSLKTSDPVPVPMYEELKMAKKTKGESMTLNESYGLLPLETESPNCEQK